MVLEPCSLIYFKTSVFQAFNYLLVTGSPIILNFPALKTPLTYIFFEMPTQDLSNDVSDIIIRRIQTKLRPRGLDIKFSGIEYVLDFNG